MTTHHFWQPSQTKRNAVEEEKIAYNIKNKKKLELIQPQHT